ncbi:glutamate receptor-like [Macrobrachium nipponense]|uniref:glutamate receptor-like n=1 Tax=Macrobrachium nipponense TaxID=159736 RepID=UPI0030C7C726
MTTVSFDSRGTSFAGLLLISLREDDCNVNTVRRVPLSSQTSSVALLCLVTKDAPEGNGSLTLSFRVHTWLPFHPAEELIRLGTWAPEDFPEWEDLFVDRFESLEESTLRVSSDNSDMPFFYSRDNKTFDGTSKRIMDALGGWINFTSTFTESSSDDKWGEIVNGTWVGMLGDVLRGDKDLAVNYFSVTEERAQYFDFSVPHYNEGFGFTIRVPPPLPRWLSLTYPFTPVVWGGVVVALVLIAVAYYFLREQHASSFFESFMDIAKSLINQGGIDPPDSWTIRTFLLIWWVSAFVIVLSYTCNLIAVLTIPAYPKRIRSIGQLAESNFRVCMLDYGEFVPEALATSKDAELFALGSKLDLVPTTVHQDYFGEEGCVELVLQGTHAHVETFSYNQLIYIEMGYSDAVYFVREQIYKANLAFFFRKHTPWKFKFDEGIRRLVESGLVQKWYDDIMAEIRMKNKREVMESSEQSLSMAHLQGPFLILAFGLVVSSVAFITEYLRK